MRCVTLFLTDPATTEIYPLSLHDALPILLLFRELGDQQGMALSLYILSVVPLMKGDIDAARVRTEEALALFRAMGEIGRAHVRTPVTRPARMPSSACTKSRNCVARGAACR